MSALRGAKRTKPKTKTAKKSVKARTPRTNVKKAILYRKFAKKLREVYDVSKACKAIGVSRSTAYKWRRLDPEFAKKWDEAWENIVDELEASTMQLAIQGSTKPVYQQGHFVGHMPVQYPVLRIFMLKKNSPDKYDDKPFDVAVGNVSELIERMQVLKKQHEDTIPYVAES